MRLLAVACVLLLPLLATVAPAATVKEVDVDKKTVTVELEDGESFEKDSEVCFFEKDAKKSVACGTVSKVKGTLVTVKVKTTKKLKKVTDGMTAKPDGGGDSKGGDDAESADGAKKGKKKKAKNPLRIIGVYNPALSSPFTYRKLAYQAPSSTAADTLWAQDKTVGKSIKDNPLSLSLGVAIPIGSLSVIPGFRYRTYTPSLIDADYVNNRENPFVSTEMSATSIGVFADFMYFRGPIVGHLLFADLTGGLDVDMSTITIKANKKDDSRQAAAAPDSEIASAESKLTVISLRVGAGIEVMPIKLLGARLGLNLQVPILAAGGQFSGSLADNESRASNAPADDLKNKVDHKKNSLGIEIAFGMVLAF